MTPTTILKIVLTASAALLVVRAWPEIVQPDTVARTCPEPGHFEAEYTTLGEDFTVHNYWTSQIFVRTPECAFWLDERDAQPALLPTLTSSQARLDAHTVFRFRTADLR